MTYSANRTIHRTVLTFDQPAKLLSMNDRLHWRHQRARAREWRKAGKIAGRKLGSLLHRVHGPSIITLELPVADRRRRDPANYAPITKAVVDGLVDAGLWPDDTPEFVTTTEPVLTVFPKGSIPVARVHIRPRPESFNIDVTSILD